MTAIATNKFKKLLIESVINDLGADSNEYYVGLSKSDQWSINETVPGLANTEEEDRNFRTNLQSIKTLINASFVSLRYNWSNGTIYKSYSDSTVLGSIGQYYVLTENQRIYICLEPGKDATGLPVASTINPDTIGTGTISKRTSDGYVWKYLLTLSSVRSNFFLSANYLPVNKVSTATNTVETTQLGIQNAAVPGSIVGYRLLNAGAGYSPTSTINIIGNGTGAAATATVDATTGSITKIEITDSSNESQFIGSGYNYANVTITSDTTPTTSAIIKPIISRDGIGADPRDDINANYLMFNVKPDGAEGGDFLVNQDFRQVGLIKNPKEPINDSDFMLTTGNALNKLSISSVSGSFANDATIRGVTSDASAYVNKYTSNTIYYHQNENTGYTPFTLGESIQDSADPGGNNATIDADSSGEVNPFSGELFYIENRSPVTRDSAQTEDIKIIVQL